MIEQPTRHSAVSTDPTSTSGKYIASETDDFAGAVQFAHDGANVPPANGYAINAAHSTDSANHAVGNADSSVGNHAAPDWLLTIDDSANASGDVHSGDQPQWTISSTADFVNGWGTGQGLLVETQHTALVDTLNNNDLSGLFDHIDSLVDGSTNSSLDGGFSAPLDFSFDSPQSSPFGLPDVFSDARPGGGHSGGGGGGGGGTTPSAYTTTSGTGVDIHVTYDSSVGKAPAGFTSTVQHVADFFASAFQDASSHITINIDVGYGEVDNMHLGRGALGSSVTYLQSVSDTQLTSAYSESYLNDVTLGGSPATGNLYVSFAEAKALGISVPNTIDGYVGFSSQGGIFDYNNADGVSSGQYDFFGAVAHEFSEVMGRILLVGGTINGAASYMAYDLFHYANGVQDFSGNGGYFSTDGGSTMLAIFNNPSNGGDAGDWASGSAADAFNAFGTTGVVAPVTNTDLWALHAVGFDLAQPVTV
jgi:hypothetical protein